MKRYERLRDFGAVRQVQGSNGLELIAGLAWWTPPSESSESPLSESRGPAAGGPERMLVWGFQHTDFVLWVILYIYR